MARIEKGHPIWERLQKQWVGEGKRKAVILGGVQYDVHPRDGHNPLFISGNNGFDQNYGSGSGGVTRG